MKLSKRLTALFVAVLMAITVFTSTIPVMAADEETTSQGITESSDVVSTLASASNIPSVSLKFTDKYSNQYQLSGSCIRLNYDATLVTGFKVTKYNDTSTKGKNTVNNYTKSCSAKGEVVYLTNQKTDSLSVSGNKTGSSGDVRVNKTFSKYLYSLKGIHTVSCNGSSISGVTFDAIF